MHKYFKLDGSTQGLPVCTLYANRVKNRFDWFKNANNVYVQIGALVEYTNKEATRLFVVGFHCTENGVKASSSYPLPKIRYLITVYSKLPHMSCDSVDCIAEPVAVIPSSLRITSYFVKNIDKRAEETFCIIPAGFVYRDDWEDSNNEQLSIFKDRLLNKFSLREYYKESPKNMSSRFHQIMDIIRNIGATGDPTTDEEVIEEVRELQR